MLVDCIKEEIERRVDGLNLEANECFHFITCLNEATQNFRPAIKAMGLQVNIIVRFIADLLELYDDQLKNELSPAQKNDVCRHLHCCLQALIFCFKNYIKEQQTSEETGSEIKLNLDRISAVCTRLLDNPDVPMDTMNNCSMLIVMYSKLSFNDEFMIAIMNPASDPGKRLSLIFGVINALDTSIFCSEGSNSAQEHATLSKNLNEISAILEKLFNKSSVEPSLMLSISRSFMQITKKFTAITSLDVLQHFEGVTNSALSVGFLNLEHHMDSVRHLSRETMRNLAEIGMNAGDEKLMDKIFHKVILNRVLHPNLESTVISSILPVVKANQILNKLPGFTSALLELIGNGKEANVQVDCYTALASKSLEGIPFDKWFAEFAQPAIDLMIKQKSHTEKKLVFENILVQLLKKEKKVLDMILKHREEFDVGFIFFCLSSSKKNGCLDKERSTDEMWKGVVSYDEIKNTMIHEDDKVRTSALMLIIETRKTVEGFSEQELDCFMHFLKYNINVQSPSMRQSIFGMAKNFFVRIQAVVQAHSKKKEQQKIDFYFNFLTHLQEFCLGNLFEGANFTRRTLALRILFYIVEAVDRFFAMKASEIWDQVKFDVLMNVLNDSYEANKEMAIEIMKFIPKAAIRDFTSVNFKQLEMMVTSIKPPESLTVSIIV